MFSGQVTSLLTTSKTQRMVLAFYQSTETAVQHSEFQAFLNGLVFLTLHRALNMLPLEATMNILFSLNKTLKYIHSLLFKAFQPKATATGVKMNPVRKKN
jgi:hypothetical protein